MEKLLFPLPNHEYIGLFKEKAWYTDMEMVSINLQTSHWELFNLSIS